MGGPTIRPVAHRLAAVVTAVVLAFSACGGDDNRSGAAGEAAASEGASGGFAGYRTDPMIDVSQFELPNLISGTAETLAATPGKIRVIYFGYTNCPDYCPTTMSDLQIARNRLDEPQKIEPGMVTIDPDRDLPVLEEYVTAFFDDGLAYGTDDAGLLQELAHAVGVTYQVEPNPEAETDPQAEEVVVSHSTSLYAFDDQGRLVLTWPFGIPVEDLAHDLELLIDEAEAAA